MPLLSRAGGPAKGTITLTAEELSGANNEVHFTVHGMNLASLDWIGSSDPILALYRGGADGTWVKVHGALPTGRHTRIKS